MAPSGFQNILEVATGHCKNAVIRVGGHFLSSLFSPLSSLGLRLRSCDPALTAEQIDLIFTMDSDRGDRTHCKYEVDLPRRGGVEIGRAPKKTPLFGPLKASLFSLLSSLFSLLLVDSYLIASRIPPGQE